MKTLPDQVAASHPRPRRLLRNKAGLIGAAFLALILAAPAQAQQSWVRVALPFDLSVEVPANWIVLSDNARVTIQAWAETYTGGASPSDLDFAANLYDDRGNTIALLNVRYYPDLDITQAEARAATDADVADLDALLRSDLEPNLSAAGIELLEWKGTSRTDLPEVVAFVTEYRRTSIVGTGAFRVRLVRVFNAEHSFTVTVSYHESLEALLVPITDRIINSVEVGEIMAAQQSPMTMVYGEGWPFWLGASFLLTWGIGLAPPALIRYGIRRRPIGRGAAIGLVAGFWVFNVLLFSAMGSQRHSA
ncbi:MAG: hypothetical protein WD942_04300, partial [Dehalococcoidia bacterium]